MDTTFYLTSSTSSPYAIQYSVIPPPSNVGNTQVYPFTITISAADYAPHVIDLYSQFSRSQPYTDEQNKWSHLVPQWRFLDVSGNVIHSLTTIDTTIYSGTTAMGITGSASFYYVDDISSDVGSPVILWATLNVSNLPLLSESRDEMLEIPSYANSKVIAGIPYYINGLIPLELRITRNGIDEMSDSTYWINQKVPSIITINGNKHFEFGCTSTSGLSILYDYPSSNSLGIEQGPINMGLENVPLSAQIWTTLDELALPYFQAYDSRRFSRGGYSRNVVISNQTSYNTSITASASGTYYAYQHTPYAFIANPDNNLLHKIEYPYLNSTIVDGITSWLDGFNIVGLKDNYSVPFLTERPTVMNLTGFGGIYGIAIDPCFNIWGSDGEMDKIYKFNSAGEILLTIDLSDTTILSAYGVSGGCTPAGITLDSKNKLWVTLFDSSSVLQFDGINGSLLNIIDPAGNQESIIGGFSIDPDFKPTLAETDKYDNIWVSYTNSLCSYFNKYDLSGILLSSIGLPLCSNPMDIIVDNDNDVWLSLTYHSKLSGGEVRKYDGETGIMLSSISTFHPEYITLDNTNKLWFTYGFNGVSCIDLNNNNISNFTIGVSTEPTWYNNVNDISYNALEGIAADSTNRIWVINSLESKVYVLSGTQVQTIYDLPTNKTLWNVDTDFSVLTSENEYAKSIQAFGDWTGLRWYQKYTSTEYFNVTGQSEPFDIDTNTGYDIRKFNESWDATTQLRDYAINERFYNNVNLFENYLGTMMGGLETSANGMARILYEKIANFVPNNADVDVCGINQLYSMGQEIDVPIDDYNFKFPTELKRTMDLVSINHQKLWGDRCKCNYNYLGSYGTCSNCGHNHDSNRGDGIDTDNYLVSAGVPFLAEYKFDRDYYELITPLTQSVLVSTVSTILTPVTYITALNVKFDGVFDDDYRITITSPSTSYVLQNGKRNITWYNTTANQLNFPNEEPNTYGKAQPSAWNAYISGLNIPIDNRIDIDGFDGWAGSWRFFPVTVSISAENGDTFSKYLTVLSNTINTSMTGVSISALVLPTSTYFGVGSGGPWFETYIPIGSMALSSYNFNIGGAYLTSYVYGTSTEQVSTFSIFNYASTYLLNDVEDYCYFLYIPTICNTQTEGVINWSDERTTISENISSLEAWFEDGEIVEKIINYQIHNRLGI